MSLIEPEAQLHQALQMPIHSPGAPTMTEVAEALQQVECTRRTRPPLDYGQLLGAWRLFLVVRPRSSWQAKPLAQRVPGWLSIHITYMATHPATGAIPPVRTSSIHADSEQGWVTNQVQLGLLTLTLTGPTLFYHNRSILAFDFTHLQLRCAGRVIYDGGFRGGTMRDTAFYNLSLKEQAFFNFFWYSPQGIAARGKGGGLALWTREHDTLKP
jgi:hypothetical protein